MTGNLVAGTPVRVEVDGNGRVGVEPPSRGDAVFSAVAAATAVTLGGILLLVFAWMGIRAAVLARNCSAWERRVAPGRAAVERPGDRRPLTLVLQRSG